MGIKAAKPEQANVTYNSLFLISLAVLLIQVAAGGFIYYTLGSWSERANFGDMFGAVSTLFSGLAFAGVIYAVHLQRRELELQRAELQMTRDELKRTADAQEKSEQALAEQARMMAQSAQIQREALEASIKAQQESMDISRQAQYRAEAAQERSSQAMYEQTRLMEMSSRLAALTSLFEAQKNVIELLHKEGIVPTAEIYITEKQRFNELRQDLEREISRIV